jgi:hypothetical protein
VLLSSPASNSLRRSNTRRRCSTGRNPWRYLAARRTTGSQCGVDAEALRAGWPAAGRPTVQRTPAALRRQGSRRQPNPRTPGRRGRRSAPDRRRESRACSRRFPDPAAAARPRGTAGWRSRQAADRAKSNISSWSSPSQNSSSLSKRKRAQVDSRRRTGQEPMVSLDGIEYVTGVAEAVVGQEFTPTSAASTPAARRPSPTYSDLLDRMCRPDPRCARTAPSAAHRP